MSLPQHQLVFIVVTGKWMRIQYGYAVQKIHLGLEMWYFWKSISRVRSYGQSPLWSQHAGTMNVWVTSRVVHTTCCNGTQDSKLGYIDPACTLWMCEGPIHTIKCKMSSVYSLIISWPYVLASLVLPEQIDISVNMRPWIHQCRICHDTLNAFSQCTAYSLWALSCRWTDTKAIYTY